MPHLRPLHSLEILESRIAPAAVTLSFFDQDNKAVSVVSTKGTLAQLEAAVGVTSGATAMGPLNFDFSTAPTVFKGADITVTAGANATDAIFTRVQTFTANGLDLGKVSIDGELDQIFAGDLVSSSAALKSLTVASWGNGDAYDSVVVGAINTLTVLGDFNGGYLKVRGSDSENRTPPEHVTDLHGKIGSLFIGGSLLGTAREDGGHILATGDIPNVTVVGSVVGYAEAMPPQVPPTDQDFNARIFAGGVINSLTIGTDAKGGSVQGGDGAFSGQIVGVVAVKNITVKGSVQGGIGLESGAIGTAGSLGNVIVTENLYGDFGTRSGTLLSRGTIGNVTIGGNIQGGVGFNSGAIGSILNIGTVVVTGDVTGGPGDSSGQIVSQGTIKSVTVQNLIGAGGFESGAIGSLKGLGAIVVKDDIYAGEGTRSGIISTDEIIGFIDEGGPRIIPNAPIASVTVGGSIIGEPLLVSTPGDSAGGIFAGGQLGPVVVGGDLIGGDNYRAGQIASTKGITSVKIGGWMLGGTGVASGAIGAATTIGSVAIGDPDFHGESEGGFFGYGIAGGIADRSGSIVAGQIGKVDIFGNIAGGNGIESGAIVTFASGTSGGIGPVNVRGGVFGGSPWEEFADRSGSIVSGGTIASVMIGSDEVNPGGSLIGGGGVESGAIISHLALGPVTIFGSLIGDLGDNSGSILSDATIASVKIGQSVRGGDGDGSGAIFSAGNMGGVTIGTDPHSAGDLIGGAGENSGSVVSNGKLAKIDIIGNVLGDDGASSGTIQSHGDMGAVFIGHSLVGSFGSASASGSGAIFSGGKIASITIGDPKDTDVENGGNVRGGIAYGSGSITSEMDMGPVKIKGSLIGGSGDESGKIASGGKIASLTIGSPDISGSIVGGSGNYDTTVENVSPRLGQVFAAGAIGAISVSGDIDGDPSGDTGGAYAAHIRGLSIASVAVGGTLYGGAGFRSGALAAASGNIGKVTISSVLGGDGPSSGYIAAEGNLPSVKIEHSLASGSGPGSGFVAAGGTLGSLEVDFVSGNAMSRARISAGDKISAVTIRGSIYYSDILSGYNTSGFGFNPDAQIGTVKIGISSPGDESPRGYMLGTNIVAGISAEGDFMFGTYDDLPIFMADNPKVYSKIASVIVLNRIDSTTASSIDTYGIVAQHLVSVKIGGIAKLLAAGALNDEYREIDEAIDTVFGEFPFLD